MDRYAIRRNACLTPLILDFEDKTIRINKTYNTKEKKTVPQNICQLRTISVPDFLLADIKDYMNSVYGLTKHDRLFQVTKYYMEHEKERALKTVELAYSFEYTI